MKKLEGKVALVTGGNSGIGLATAQQLVADGAYVFITGRRQSELDAAVRQIGNGVTGIHGDVSKLADLDRLFAAVKEQKRYLNIVFANAGIAVAAPLGEITEEAFDQHFAINEIRVNVVSPGVIETPGLSGLMNAEYDRLNAAFAERVPLGRLGHPEEVAKAVSFLASDESSYVTGIELFVDGGLAQI